MVRPASDFELDPVVVPIPDDSDLTIDDWLASLLREDPPIDLTVPSADLIAGARAESE